MSLYNNASYYKSELINMLSSSSKYYFLISRRTILEVNIIYDILIYFVVESGNKNNYVKVFNFMWT